VEMGLARCWNSTDRTGFATYCRK